MKIKVNYDIKEPKWPNYVRRVGMDNTVGESAIDIGSLDSDAFHALAQKFKEHWQKRSEAMARNGGAADG